jgi:hypothetical protein
MIENEKTESATEVKEVIIGDFKPKRKFLNFVSAVNAAKIRFISDVAFIKGEKLSGQLEGVIFKITICDEGTIKFEEVDTNVTDRPMIQRLIDDIDSMDVTGYAQKFVVSGIEFTNKDGVRCYLEIEHKKPIDKLASLFDEEETKMEVSEKGLSILDQLFGSDDEIEITPEKGAEVFVEDIEIPTKPNEELKLSSNNYIEEQFKRMNEEKIEELKRRIENTKKDVIKWDRDIKHAESKMKESKENLKILESRLESIYPGDEPNGYVFYISEEQKLKTGLDESTRHIADKIADLMKLKKDVLFDYLTGGYYKIKIAKKDDMQNESPSIERDILEKLLSIDTDGKITMIENGNFEYRGELNWHQLVNKMIRKGFEQDPEFDKFCESNSYFSKEEEKYEDTCSHDNCGC